MSPKTLDAFDLRSLWPSTWGVGGHLVIELTASLTSDEAVYPQGNFSETYDELGFHWESDTTVTDSLATCGSIADLPTTDRRIYRVSIFDEYGQRRLVLSGSNSWRIVDSLSSVFKFETWEAENHSPVYPAYHDAHPTNDDVLALFGSVASPYASDLVAGKGYASVPPVSASHPTFVGDNDPRVRDASSYASFAVAVSALALDGGGTLHITDSQTVSNSGTIPASVHLEFKKGGYLDIATGQTVTILGPITAPPMQIFDGAGSVSFAGNKYLKEAYVNWWPLNNDGATNDAANLQKVASAMTSGMTLIATPQTDILINSTATFAHLANFSFQGINPVGQQPTNAAKIRWGGSAHGTMFIYDCVRESSFKNLWIVPNGADVCLSLDQLTTTGGGDVSSSLTVEGNFFDSRATNNSAWVAVKIYNASGTNNEQHVLRNNRFVGYTQTYGSRVGVGVYLGHSNVKAVESKRNFYVGLATAVSGGGGSFHSDGDVYSGIDTALGGYFSDSLSITNSDIEDVTSIVNAGGFGTVPLLVNNVRANDVRGGQAVSGTTTNTPVFNFPTVGGGNLYPTILASTFAAAGNAPFTSDFIKDASAAGAGGSLSLNWFGNTVIGTTTETLLPGFNTFKGGFATDQNGKPIIFGKQAAGSQTSLDGAQSNGARRTLLRVFQDTNTTTANFTQPGQLDSLQISDSVIEIQEVVPVADLSYSLAGTTGTTRRVLRVIPLDANGNQSNGSNEIDIPNCNATLSGTNKIIATCRHSPGTASYDVIERDYSAGNTYRLVMNQAASGTGTQTFNITSNPSGAFTYSYPSYNKTAVTLIRGPRVEPQITTFADGAATPAVSKGNYFQTANTGATVITNFTQGYDGQSITVLVDANTTIQHNASIKNRSGANIVGAANVTHSFLRLSSVWYQQN